MNRGLKALSVVTTVVMYIVVLMGALVTNTGSGQGCGQSYPLCKGTFMPDWDWPAIIEFSHRAVSGMAGMLTVALLIWVWQTRPIRPLLRYLAAASLFFVCLQGALGALAVVWPQPTAILALHFGFSILCFSSVLLVTALVFKPSTVRTGPKVEPRAELHPFFRRWVWFVAIFTYVVVYLGAYVRHLKASPACLGWPLCNGQLIPPLYGLVGVNFIHRVAAALLVLVVVRLFIMSRQFAGNRREVRRAADLALFLILLQVASGAVIALGQINLLTQMIHTAIVAAYWGTIGYLWLAVLPQSLDQPLPPKEVAKQPAF